MAGGAQRNPDTVSHTLFPLIRDFRSGSAARRSLIDPDVLGWPALLDCRMRLTAFLPPHRTDAAGRSECSTTEAWLLDCRMRLTAFLPPHRTDAAGRSECSTTEAWHHWPHRHCPKFRRRRRSSAYRHHRPWVSISPIGTIAPIDGNRLIIDSIDSE